MIYVLGAGGHAKAVISLLRELGHIIGGAFDDDPCRRDVLGVPILGAISQFGRFEISPAVVAIGDNAARKAVAERFQLTPWATLVSRAATVDPAASLGPGTVVFPDAVVQVGVRVGSHVILNVGSCVGHESNVADYVHVSAGATLAGEVTIEEGGFMCLNSTAIPRVRVGAWSVVGAGSAAHRDVPCHATAIGVPARVTRQPASRN